MGGENEVVVSSFSHSRIILFCFGFETGTGYVTQPCQEPKTFLLRLPNAGIVGAHHHTHKV